MEKKRKFRIRSGPELYLHRLVKGNRYGCRGEKSQKNRVNIEHSAAYNLGDTLSPIIVNWMLDQRGIDKDAVIKSTKHLFAVGSLIGRGSFDATIWGTGILRPINIKTINIQKRFRKYDIRAVRGPVTQDILQSCGYTCPSVYGDPAILMPEIYSGIPQESRTKITLVLHYVSKPESISYSSNVEYLSPATNDYQSFIKTLQQSKLVISSSLHGIILAEAYNIPSVFLMEGQVIPEQLMKFEDYYRSTNRSEFKIAKSVEEAIDMGPMELPDLDDMRCKLKEAFPYDLWTNER